MNINRLSIGIYAAIVLVTVWLFLAIGYWEDGAESRLISLLALLFAETMGWLMIGYAGANGRRGRPIAARLLFVTVTVLYGAAVVVHIFLFWLVLSVSFSSYAMIHLATWAVWALGMGIAYAYAKHVDGEATRTMAQTRLVGRMQAVLLSIGQTLEQLNRKELERLSAEAQALLEQVTYSDPVSHRSVAYMEDSLLWQIDELEKCVQKIELNSDDAGSIELSRQLIADISKDLVRRNSQLQKLIREKRE